MRADWVARVEATEGAAITDSNAPRSRRERRYDGSISDLDPDFEVDEYVEGPRKRRVWPWIVLVIFLLLIAIVVVGGVFAIQALKVKDDLQAAKGKISAVVPLMKKGDTAGVEALSKQVLKLTSDADKIVAGPLWDIASIVPGVGANVVAVSETTKATHILVRDALPLASSLLPLADPANFKVEGGGINLAPFREAEPKLPQLSAIFDNAKTHIDRIDMKAIHPYIKSNISQIVDIVDTAAPTLSFAQENLPVLLSTLGADGPRNYALLFQNNAEIRATGGNPGAGAVLTVDNGKVTMRQDQAALNFVLLGPKGRFPQHLADPAEEKLFEGDTWSHSQNYTRTPDFADTAHLVGGLWNQTVGGKLDGVISIDPITLSYMLQVAGPVQVPDETTPVTADNAVKLLLSDTYERFGAKGDLADLYFAKVSAAVFSKVMSGGWDPLKMVEQLQKATREQRVYAWFADEKQQAMATQLGIDGKITTDNKTVTQTGIYLNDSSHSKLEYYLSSKIMVTCSAEKRTVTTTIELHNAVPRADLSHYTLGARNGRWGQPRTTMMLDVVGIALPGGKLVGSSPEKGARKDQERSGLYKGREAKSMLVNVPMGGSKKVSFTSTVPDDATKPLQVRYSPTVGETPVTIDGSCGTMFPAS
ncbi:DUF4012 domain-containing protein [Microbacterium arabinogalactanolyticum]|uniref:DUF4012 domain-containing protein n=1 Tax=Microbacterium arabinogalactanolyticum TaxID=69365 RepID=UPI002552A4C8|nr:DUF4012 domain-containing protein [Microbacterium arabinogalactanolyticum]GLC85367.1 hypothetical protein MIAR_19540 [Microbacterium arabinogalactanolyticum]